MADAEGAATSRSVWGVQALLLAAADSLSARFGVVCVRAELGAFTRAASGHCYFTLKDARGTGAVLRCAMFRRAASLIDFDPREQQQVEVYGRVSVYEPRGELQLVVEAMRRVGAGSLFEEFLRLKARLEAAGLFADERKRALPPEPRCIGVVTSPGAAAWHDVRVALARRAPHVRVVLYPAAVQGSEAPPALVAALDEANRRADAQLLLLVRGGGSLEDLWAFNDERVVRAVAASKLPVVCGVGHETDVSLSDLAADLRAPTPTAAAELATPSRDELLRHLLAVHRRLLVAGERQLERQAQRTDRLALRLGVPAAVLGRERQRLSGLAHRLHRALSLGPAQHRVQVVNLQQRLQRALALQLDRRQQQLTRGELRLAALDPQQVLGRGYAWIEGDDGRAVCAAGEVRPGQGVTAVWHDGRARALITEVQTMPAPSPHGRRG